MKESTKSRKVRVFFFCKWHKKGKPLKEKRGRGKKLWDSSFKVTNKYTSLILSQVKKIWEQNLANMSSVVATLQKVEAGISLVQGYSQLQHQVWGQSWLRPFWKLKKKNQKTCIRTLKLASHELQFPMSYRLCKYTYIHVVITSYFLVPTKENSHILQTLNHNTIIRRT